MRNTEAYDFLKKKWAEKKKKRVIYEKLLKTE